MILYWLIGHFGINSKPYLSGRCLFQVCPVRLLVQDQVEFRTSMLYANHFDSAEFSTEYLISFN